MGVYIILCPGDDENMWLCTLLCVRTMLRIPCGCVHNSVFGRWWDHHVGGCGVRTMMRTPCGWVKNSVSGRPWERHVRILCPDDDMIEENATWMYALFCVQTTVRRPCLHSVSRRWQTTYVRIQTRVIKQRLNMCLSAFPWRWPSSWSLSSKPPDRTALPIHQGDSGCFRVMYGRLASPAPAVSEDSQPLW